MKRIHLIGLLTILLFVSCNYVGGNRVKGNGNIVTQDRSVSRFDVVDVSGAIRVYVKQDSTQSVRVETDANLQELVEIREQGGVLYISPKDNFNLDPSNNKVKVYVSAPHFRGFGVSGASDVYSENRITSGGALDLDISGASEIKIDTKVPRINTEVSGASSVMLTGETRDFTVEGSGASGVKCFDLKTENASVDISGACSAEIFASVKLDVHASGASGVKYRGTPAITQDLSGASNLRKVD